MMDIELREVPLLDMSRLATEEDAHGKAECEWWFRDVPAALRAEVVERIGTRSPLAVTVRHGGRHYRLSWRRTMFDRCPMVMFVGFLFDPRTQGDESLLVVLRDAGVGRSPLVDIMAIGRGGGHA